MRSAALLLLAALSRQSLCSSPPEPKHTSFPEPKPTSFVHFEVPHRPERDFGKFKPWYYSDHVHSKLPLPTEVPRRRMIKTCGFPGVTALTFDDGPSVYTSHVLDLLDEYSIKGTFFINGDNWSNNIADESGPWPDLLRRMDKSGHQIGSHGWSHIDMSKVDSQTFYHELHDLEVAIFNVLGKYPAYFRPPFGLCDAECISRAEQMGYHVVGWDTDVEDWKLNTPELLEEAIRRFNLKVFPMMFDSYIILMHDVQENTVKLLLPLILHRIHVRSLQRLNLTVADCWHSPPEKWYQVPSSDWDPNPSPRYFAPPSFNKDDSSEDDSSDAERRSD